MGVRRLVTETDVRAMAPGAELVLEPGTIATPAALDLAFERRIRVLRPAEAGAAPAGRGAHEGCVWSRMLGEDGTYVVVVRGGRADVTRLGEGGPAPFATKAERCP